MQFTYDKTDVGIRIRHLREKRNVTYKEMADSLGGTEADYIDIERGNSNMLLKTALQIADFFDITIDELLYGDKADIQEKGKEEEMILSLLERNESQKITEALKLMQEYLLN